jgi:hypothetical protein
MEPHEQPASSRGYVAALGFDAMLSKLFLAALVFMPGLLHAKDAEPKLRPEMLVTTGWLAENLSEPDVIVLCINSTPEFYSKGHIPGARQIKLEDIAVTRDGIPNELPPVETLKHVFEAAGVSNSSRVILYGERLNLLAARAYFTLDISWSGGTCCAAGWRPGEVDSRTASSFNRNTAVENDNACGLTAAGDSGGYQGDARTFAKEAGKRDAARRAAHKRIHRGTALRRCGQSRAHSRSERSLLDGHARQSAESRAEA